MMSDSEKGARIAIERRSIGSAFSHLWSDALFGRQQARKCAEREKQLSDALADSKKLATPISGAALGPFHAELSQRAWDRGIYVRWTVVTAYMAFERVCCDALGAPRVGDNLRENLPKAFAAKGVEQFDWAASPWKEVNKIRETRNKFVHGDCTGADLFGDLSIAENAIDHLRAAIIEVYRLLGADHALWVEADEVPDPLGCSSAWPTLISEGATNDGEAFTIKAVHGGAESDCYVIRSDEDPWPRVEHLARNVRVPITAIRIFKGTSLWEEIVVSMRGGAVPRHES